MSDGLSVCRSAEAALLDNVKWKTVVYVTDSSQYTNAAATTQKTLTYYTYVWSVDVIRVCSREWRHQVMSETWLVDLEHGLDRLTVFLSVMVHSLPQLLVWHACAAHSDRKLLRTGAFSHVQHVRPNTGPYKKRPPQEDWQIPAQRSCTVTIISTPPVLLINWRNAIHTLWDNLFAH